MTYDELLEQSVEELRLKTRAHQGAWHFGEETYWNLDQDSGELAFTFENGTIVRCSAQIVGTFNEEDATWMWAWNNSSIDPALVRDAELVRDYGQQHQIAALTSPTWAGTELDAWKMAALAVKLAGAQGAYRGPAGSTYVFMSFGDVQLSRLNTGN